MTAIELKDGPVKDWLARNSKLEDLYLLAKVRERDGYRMDPTSGFLLRQSFPDGIIKKLGYTLLDIVFTRPTDIHYHKDVGEAIYVESGEGLAYGRVLPAPEKNKITRLVTGTSIFIPKEVPHAFKSNLENPLEVRLAYTGILKPENEVQVQRFDKLDVF